MTFSSVKGKYRESWMNVCTWEKFIRRTEMQWTVNVLQDLQYNVDEEQFRPFTVTVRQIQDERRKKEERTG